MKLLYRYFRRYHKGPFLTGDDGLTIDILCENCGKYITHTDGKKLAELFAAG